MHILRWLMKHPILLAWLLAIVAILLNFGMMQREEAHSIAHGGGESVQAEQHAAVSAPVAEQPAAAPAQPTPVPAPVAEQPAANAEPPAKTATDLLRAAREAYWSNELESAAELYSKLIQQAPDINHKGELANVYWKQGKAKEAAALFAEVAPQLAAQGRTTEAFNMKRYVDVVDPELGKKIGDAMKK
ncbi:MAG: hypothetical protein ACK4RS_02350 [Thiothrix sp.]